MAVQRSDAPASYYAFNRETKKLTARDASKGDEAEEEAPPDESADKQ